MAASRFSFATVTASFANVTAILWLAVTSENVYSVTTLTAVPSTVRLSTWYPAFGVIVNALDVPL